MTPFVDHLKRFSQLFKQLLDALGGAAVTSRSHPAEIESSINSSSRNPHR
jgi:hypothetical protein